MAEPRPMQNAFVRAVLGAAGLVYALTGAALLFAPQWFYDHIGTYPPFSRHYVGDGGAFVLPLGIAMLIAARHPAQHRLLFGYAVAGSVLHALNHMLDELVLSPSASQLLTGSVPLALFAAILAAAYIAGSARHTAD